MICTSSDFLLLAFRSELFVTDVHNYSTPTAWNFDLEGVWASRSQWEGVSISKALDMTHFCIWFILILSSELMHRFDAVQPFRRFWLSRRSQSRGAMRSARGTCQTHFFLFFGFVDFVVGNVENVPNSTSLLGWWWLKPGQVHDSRPRAPAESRQDAHAIECVCGRSPHTYTHTQRAQGFQAPWQSCWPNQGYAFEPAWHCDRSIGSCCSREQSCINVQICNDI